MPNLIGAAAVAPLGSTNIVMILDRSGSMAGKESDVIGGFNSFVSSCRDASLAHCSVTYIRFDTEVERVFTEELKEVPQLTDLLYRPRGNTALLDAVGQSVSARGSARSRHCTTAGRRGTGSGPGRSAEQGGVDMTDDGNAESAGNSGSEK